MAREDMGRMTADLDSGRPMNVTGRFFRQDREDRPVFRPLPRNWRSPGRPINRQYDRYFSRTARR
jgi:hypothetical protein